MPYQYGETTRGQLLQFAHDVCALEMGVSMEPTYSEVRWTGNAEAYSGYLALNPVHLKYQPKGREGDFLIPEFVLVLDKGETQLRIADQIEDSLDGDPYALWMLGEAKHLFECHNHDVCIDIAEAKRQEEEAHRTRLVTVRASDGTIILD